MSEASVELDTLNCPKCGAPYGGSGSCGYCGSKIFMGPQGAVAKPTEITETIITPTPLETHQSWVGEKFQEANELVSEIATPKEMKLALGGAVWTFTAGLQALMGDWPRWAQDAGGAIQQIQTRGLNVNQIIDTGREILKLTFEHPHESAAIAAATAAALYYTAFIAQGVDEDLSEE